MNSSGYELIPRSRRGPSFYEEIVGWKILDQDVPDIHKAGERIKTSGGQVSPQEVSGDDYILVGRAGTH